MPAPGERKKAKLAGSVTYFTGIPCPHGHVTERYTGSGACIGCRLARRAEDGFLEKHREACKRSYQKNREKVNRWQKEYYANNYEKVKARKDSWRARNPEKAASYVLNRRSRISLNGGGQITAAEIMAIVHRQKGKCAVCGVKTKLTMDHIMPVVLGGVGDRTNFQGLCKPCNSRKHARHPIDFNRSRGLLL